MRTALVSCSKAKLIAAARASELYSSPLFRKAMAIASKKYGAWYVVSAEHGLVEPEAVLEPYDRTLSELSAQEQRAWARTVASVLREKQPDGLLIDLYAGSAYTRFLVGELELLGFVVGQPLAGKSLGHRLRMMNSELVALRESEIDRFYSLIDRLRSGGALKSFSDLNPSDLPKRGIYFFFQPGEIRLDSDTPRVVRIGTHGVSMGSKSSLWNRLKTHRGTRDAGSHRSSIFRLHVGNALRAQRGVVEPASWGIGMNAPADVRVLEVRLESDVSEFMNSLQVAWVNIDDDSSATSDRAVLESQLISLLSNKMCPSDLPSSNWLGACSPVKEIRSSGLWNIRSVSGHVASGTLDLFEYYVDVTLGVRPSIGRTVSMEFLTERDEPRQIVMNELIDSMGEPTDAKQE